MKLQATFIDLALKEWLLILSIIGFVLLSLYTRHFPAFSINELQVLFILFVLFVTVNGLQKSGLILKIAQKVEKGKLIPLKLVLATFFLSMLITNDIALMVIVPLTLSLNINRKDILVILEALAANAGSALTPIGNPQNLYIYWFYNIHPFTFIKTIFPFSLVFLMLLIISSIFIVTQKELKKAKIQKLNKRAYIYGIWLIVVILIVFRILPVSIGIGVIFFQLYLTERVCILIMPCFLVSFSFLGLRTI